MVLEEMKKGLKRIKKRTSIPRIAFIVLGCVVLPFWMGKALLSIEFIPFSVALVVAFIIAVIFRIIEKETAENMGKV